MSASDSVVNTTLKSRFRHKSGREVRENRRSLEHRSGDTSRGGIRVKEQQWKSPIPTSSDTSTATAINAAEHHYINGRTQ